MIRNREKFLRVEEAINAKFVKQTLAHRTAPPGQKPVIKDIAQKLTRDEKRETKC